MNAKKFFSIVVLSMILVLPIIGTSCFKVGNEDPFVSMHTRKARVIGNWTVSKLDSDVVRTENESEVQTRTVTKIENDTWQKTISIVNTDSVRDLKGKITIDPDNSVGANYINFDKNGKITKVYKYEFDEDLSTADDDASTIITTKVTETITGTWNFLGTIDDYKNKERLAIVIEDRKTTTYEYRLVTSDDSESGVAIPQLINTYVVNDKYANGEMSTVYEIAMLKNKEIHLYQAIDAFYLENTNGVGNSYQEKGFENMVLVPRE